MTMCGDWPVGVCSWSLKAGIEDVARMTKEIQLDHVHLAVGPALGQSGKAYLDAVRAQDWTITSTMIGFPQENYSSLETIKLTGGIVPDANWADNRKRFVGAVAATAELGVAQLSMHAGFLDHADPGYARTFGERIRVLADAAAEKQIVLLLETGQESAEDLRRFMEEMDHPALGVNFDPANMILYDKGDPLDAVRTLAPWIRHCHIKDATRTATPGAWGAEVPWGDGEVGADTFLRTLRDAGFAGALAIEREAGNNRLGDIKLAVDRLRAFAA
ncbi:MAG: sugar phosphate isomerase/epimerase [Kiritimatiellae bacterium]|nr:sugar phosphate isomerase/epimerase [Kiritimatiellia bacterium]